MFLKEGKASFSSDMGLHGHPSKNHLPMSFETLTKSILLVTAISQDEDDDY
jgi:hypothetical protein